jgi:hypothetical protein
VGKVVADNCELSALVALVLQFFFYSKIGYHVVAELQERLQFICLRELISKVMASWKIDLALDWKSDKVACREHSSFLNPAINLMFLKSIRSRLNQRLAGKWVVPSLAKTLFFCSNLILLERIFAGKKRKKA